MTDLDVYFWRFFAFGAGFALMWRVWPWLALMGRAARHWFTLRDEAQAIFDAFYRGTGRWAFKAPDYWPDWYKRYIAFRETGYLK